MGFCTNCGTELSDDTKFCTGCGKRIEQPTSQMPAADAHAAATKAAPATVGTTAVMPRVAPASADQQASTTSTGTASNKPFIIVIVIAAVVLLVSAAVVVFTVIGSGGSASTASAPQQPIAQQAPSSASSSAASNNTSSQAASSSSSTSAAAASADADYVLPDSNARYVSAADLSSLSDWDLYLARNEIFARYGRGFKNSDLVTYFNGKDWYHQRYTPEQFDAMDTPLNEYELKNLEVIQGEEEKRNSPYRV